MDLIKYLNFKISDENNFPEKECVIPDDEDNIFSSDKLYWCLIEDGTGYEIKKLMPYIWENNEKIFYGWNYNGSVYNNKINGVYGDSEFYQNVIGFTDISYNIKSRFTKSTFENFPIDECTTYNEKENIYTSSNEYICLVIDKRFEDVYRIVNMFPYITKEEDGIYLAWLNDEIDFIDNFDHSVHGDCWDEYVIGFIKAD